ncbi:hypothetical protein HAX54_034004 [Datura stramonium]|uniref:Uncharacterized protein n=1 Tax=Datura stramonium TaxID=4076 RepID=A0ABS8VDF4_DATST|nr:hypothetical protein [Datura stramonium]
MVPRRTPHCSKRRPPRACHRTWDRAASRMPTHREKACIAPAIARKDWRLAPSHPPILLFLRAAGCAKVLAPRAAGRAGLNDWLSDLLSVMMNHLVEASKKV